MMFSLSFDGGPKPRRGSISASGFRPRGPYPLADLDRGVQIRWDTGPRNRLFILICCSFYKESFSSGKFQLMLTHKTGKSRDITKVAGIKKRITMGDLVMKKVTKVMVQLGDRLRFQGHLQSRDYLRSVHFIMVTFIHNQQPELIYLKKATVGGSLVLVPVSHFLTHDHLRKPFASSALDSLNQAQLCTYVLSSNCTS